MKTPLTRLNEEIEKWLIIKSKAKNQKAYYDAVKHLRKLYKERADYKKWKEIELNNK